MKRKNFSARIETESDNKEFNNLMTKEQIDERLNIIQKQYTSRSLKRRNTVSVRQVKLEDHCLLFEKLIKKSMKGKPLKQKYQAICQESGIDFNMLKQISKVEDKQNYIIKCCVDQISNNFEAILQKYKQLTPTDIIEQKQRQKDSLDLYGWLQVKSQYKSIKKRLKFALVDLIQSQNNYKKVNNFLAATSKLSSPQVSFQVTNMDSKEPSTQHTSRIQNNNEKKLILKVPEMKSQPPEIFFEWNQAVEQGYIQTGKNMHLMGYETIKKQISNGIQYKKREKIMSKCEQTGNYITEEELQYIASTSFLINKCVDRDFIQRAIHCLEDSVKSQIELNISEQILESFYFLKENQVKIRNQYFESLNYKKRKLIEQNTLNYEKHKHYSKDSLQMRVIKSKFVQYLKDAQKKKFLNNIFELKKESTLRKLKNSGNPLANIYVQKFKEIMLGIVKRFRERKGTDKIRQQNFMERNQARLDKKIMFKKGQDDFKIEKVKHMFHPPSKLLTLDSEDKQYKFKKEKILKQSKTYRLGIRNYEITQDEFQTFYSGGPMSCRQFQSSRLRHLNEPENEFPVKQKWIDEEIEIQAANKIKMAIKRYLYKKKFFKVLEKKEQLKSIDIEQRIQRCLKAKRFFEELHKELDKKQNEKLKDLSQHSPPKLPMDKMIFYPGSAPSSPYIQRASTKKVSMIAMANSRIVSQIPIKKIESNHQERQSLLNKFVKSRIDGEIRIKNRKLLQAAKMKNLAIAEAAGYTYSKADTELCDQYGNTPLFYSAKYGDEATTKFLLKIGADINQSCSNGNTPLHMAFQSGNQQIIIEFLNRNGNLNVLNNENLTPLAYGSQELLKSLNMLNCVATLKPDTARRFDNQHLFHRKIKSQNFKIDDELVMEMKMKA